MIKHELKEMLDKACELYNLIDSKSKLMEKAGAQGELCNILKYELMTFLMCLSAVDGRISRVEAQMIREYFGIEVYPIHIKEIIDENGIGEAIYYSKIPESLKIAVSVDNILNETNSELHMGISDTILELFKVFGKEMIIADQKVKIEERLSWETYITMMTRYVVKNIKNAHTIDGEIVRPGKPIKVDYDVSLDKVGRIYSLYYGNL